MPDTTGKMFFSDYKSELKVRGFDGFSDVDLGVLVNRGYFHVARRSQWYWADATDSFTVPVGQTFVSLWPQLGGELPNFRSLEKMYCTTPQNERQLAMMDKQDFFDDWLSRDLTQQSLRGEPSAYYIWQKALYVLPPPATLRTYLVHYNQRVSWMANPQDQPITPIHLDEAILEAALIRCHQRANEPTMAQYAETSLEEFFDDMRDDEQNLAVDVQERVRPDNSWL